AFLPCNNTVFVVEDEPNPEYKPLRSPYISTRDILLIRYKYENISLIFSGSILTPETGFICKNTRTNFFEIYPKENNLELISKLEKFVFENKKVVFVYLGSNIVMCYRCKIHAICANCNGYSYHFKNFECLCKEPKPKCPKCEGVDFIIKSELKKEEVTSLIGGLKIFDFKVLKYSYNFDFLKSLIGFDVVIAYNFDSIFLFGRYDVNFQYIYVLYRLLDVVKRVIVITSNSDYYPIKLLNSMGDFLNKELEFRKKHGYPPFTTMIEVFSDRPIIELEPYSKGSFVFRTEKLEEIPIFLQRFKKLIKKANVLFVKI
ncbi:MAG: hypothetical protein NZ870_01325, partial [bacterium]|nr:hypothetical protein [bacterium]